MRDGLKKAGLFPHVPATAWHKDWVVHSKSVGYGEKAVEYLADYVFRIGLSNARLVKVEQDEVTFWYLNRQTQRRVYVTLPVFSFIRRFLQHVLPQGFVKVRYFGFYAPGHHPRLALVYELLEVSVRPSQAVETASRSAAVDVLLAENRLICPYCAQPLQLVRTLPPRSRCPPDGTMASP